jgi:hypothetical protein
VRVTFDQRAPYDINTHPFRKRWRVTGRSGHCGRSVGSSTRSATTTFSVRLGGLLDVTNVLVSVAVVGSCSGRRSCRRGVTSCIDGACFAPTFVHRLFPDNPGLQLGSA